MAINPKAWKAARDYAFNHMVPFTPSLEHLMGMIEAYEDARPERESCNPSIGLAQIIKDAFFEGFGIGDVMVDEATIEGYWIHSQAKADIPPLLPANEIEGAE